MSLAVSSWFVEQAARPHLAPRRRLLLGGSDYSEWVLRWPALAARLESIDLGTAAAALSNIGGRFNELLQGGALLTTSCEIALGLTHPQSGTEWAVLYTGQPSHVTFTANGAELSLQLQGKTRTLTDLALGSAASSAGLDYTTSAWHPADLAWLLVTSHGGFSAVQSTSNPDLDYAQWQAWRDGDVVRDIRAMAYFTGEKVYQALADLARLSGMAVGFASGRLRFTDLYGAFAAEGALPLEHALEVAVTVDPAALVNRFTVEAGYDPATGRYAAQLTRVHSASQALYGPRAGRFGPRGVWHATANDGRSFVEDQLRFGREPVPRVAVRTTLAGGLHRTPGDAVTLTHTPLGIAGRVFRIVAREVNLQEATLRFELEPARHRAWEFQAQVSTVNLRARTVTAIASGRYLALEEAVQAGRVMGTDGAGVFQPLGHYGTALLALDGQQVLIAGPPASGSAQSVIQRSPDGGASATVVVSLPAGIGAVHHLFQPHSGTCLAAAASGGIWRSTDAGSSWALTWTLSPGYSVRRFLHPASGTLWGATGFDNAALAHGLHLWESLDDGLTWAPRHTVLASGDFHTGGFHALTGSEYLLGTYGGALSQLMTLRGTRTSPSSITWSMVLSQAAFAAVVHTASGHLLFGFDEELTLNGGTVFRSLDQGSSWLEDARLGKQGNVGLAPREDGTLDAFFSRMSGGARTYRYRNHAPDEVN
jgi:hypothetical protein